MKSGRIAIGLVIILALAVMFLAKTATLPSAYAATNENESTTATVTVNGFVSITLFNVSISFPNMDPGQNATGATNNAQTIQVDPSTNVDVMIYVNGSAFSGSGYSFGVGNMSLNISNTTGTVKTNASCHTSRCRYQPAPIWLYNETASPGVGRNDSVAHFIDIPTGQQPTSYTAGVRICAQQTSATISCG